LPPFLLFSSWSLFLRPSIIMPFALSTWPLALGCATETYLILMHAFSQNSQNWLAVKFDPKCGRTNLNYTGSSTRVHSRGLQRTSNGTIPWSVR
jgi:hypothetical protein